VDVPGHVLIQTRQPEHPAVRLALKHDVKAFAEYELGMRKELGYRRTRASRSCVSKAVDDALVRAEADD